jgi:hypothetical protein
VSFSAAAKAEEIPAQARISAVFSMPSFIAKASAALKPMPRTSRLIGILRDHMDRLTAISFTRCGSASMTLNT